MALLFWATQLIKTSPSNVKRDVSGYVWVLEPNKEPIDVNPIWKIPDSNTFCSIYIRGYIIIKEAS